MRKKQKIIMERARRVMGGHKRIMEVTKKYDDESKLGHFVDYF